MGDDDEQAGHADEVSQHPPGAAKTVLLAVPGEGQRPGR
jgi:hypothetical protein